MKISQLNVLTFDLDSGVLGYCDMVPIVKVIVLKLLACKIGRDVDLLHGKPILAIMQISTLNFAKIRNATLGHGIPLQNVQS